MTGKKAEEGHGETELAQAMLDDLGDPPDEQYIVFGENGEGILSMPSHMRDERARLAAKAVVDTLLGGADRD